MSTDIEKEMWTSKLRKSWQKNLPVEKLLPDTQPAYVASWIYLFGVATLAALALIIASGLVLSFEGASWYHFSRVGHFVNSMHFWSVQFFFIFMVVHIWGKFWMAAWRGRRLLTWITGALAFVGSIATAFTGYLIQTNFDSQWISYEAKDGFNSVGIGSRFNVTNFGQMILLHVAFLPVIIGVITIIHVLLVRAKGVVPPIDAFNKELGERK